MGVSQVGASPVSYKAQADVQSCKQNLDEVLGMISKKNPHLDHVKTVMQSSTKTLQNLQAIKVGYSESKASLQKLLEQASNKSEGRGDQATLYVRSDQGRKFFVAQHPRLFGDGGSAKAIDQLGKLGLTVGSKVNARDLINTLTQTLAERKTAETAVKKDIAEIESQCAQLSAHENSQGRTKERRNLAEIKNSNLNNESAKHTQEGARLIYVTTEGAAYMNNSLRMAAGVFEGRQVPTRPDMGGLIRYYGTADSRSNNSFSTARQQQAKAALELPVDKLITAFDNYLEHAKPMETQNYLYHGGRLSLQKLELIKSARLTDGAIRFAGFTSASPNRETAQGFADRHSTLQNNEPVIFKMNPAGARQVQNPTEIEGVYNRKQCFKVGSYSVENGQVVVRLEPVKDNSNPIIL